MSDEWLPDDPAAAESAEADRQIEDLSVEFRELARELTPQDMILLAPPPDLWTAIDTSTVRPERPEAPSVSRGPTSDTGDAIAEPASKRQAVSPTSAAQTTRTARRSRRLRPAWIAAAAAAVALVATGGTIFASQRNNADQLVAQAEITNDGLPVVFAESGTAEVLRDGTDLYLDLELPDLPSTTGEDAFYEVWMIDTDVVGMVSLGVVPSSGRVDLPDDLDPTAFPVVDISVEPLDGNPTHSGQSILRGVLQ